VNWVIDVMHYHAATMLAELFLFFL